jgi:hypothetical protein
MCSQQTHVLLNGILGMKLCIAVSLMPWCQQQASGSYAFTSPNNKLPQHMRCMHEWANCQLHWQRNALQAHVEWFADLVWLCSGSWTVQGLLW